MAIKPETKSKVNYIYALRDPLTQEIHYVGKTTMLRTRIMGHMSECRTNSRTNLEKRDWLNSLASKGLMPEMVILDQTDFHNAGKLESTWVKRLREQGYVLFNHAGKKSKVKW